MKIILINPPSTTYRLPEEHLGLAYLKSYLVSRGHQVKIIDAYLWPLTGEQISGQIISDSQAKIVGLSPSIDSLPAAAAITREIKKQRPDIFVCWGGHLASFSAEDLLIAEPALDGVILGEGEIVFTALVDNISSAGNLSSVKSIAYRDQGKVVFTGRQELIKDLDILPFADRENTDRALALGALVQVSASRGCYGNCSFCSINSLYKLSSGESWRGRSAGNIADELEYLKSRYGYSTFKFVDDSFFGPGEDWQTRAINLAQEIIKRQLVIRFRISTRVNNIDREVFRKLKAAGLYAVSVGIESGVQRALDTFRKGTTVKQNLSALEILKELDIITLMGFIGFDPYTTMQEIGENILFLEQTMFCLCDLISKPLFVHAQDDITKQLIKENRLTGRAFPNYEYEIADPQAARVFKHLKQWNTYNRDLYYRVADPLMAPRLTLPAIEPRLLKLHLALRKIDLKVYKEIYGMVKSEYPAEAISQSLEEDRKRFMPAWDRIEKEFNELTLNHEYSLRP